jgi:hypothetical protein
MNSKDLASVLRQAPSGGRSRAAGCPDEHEIAAYVDGTLAPSQREPLELHLARCEACCALIGVVSKAREPGTLEPVPELTLARARRVGRPPAGRWQRYTPWLATAALIVVSVSTLLQVTQQPTPVNEPPVATKFRIIRGAAPAVDRLDVLAPTVGAAVAANDLVVRWTSVPGSRFYAVRIVTESGDLVSETRVVGTEWRPGNALGLHPDSEYFVQVVAFPSEGTTLNSDHIPFSVSQRP